MKKEIVSKDVPYSPNLLSQAIEIDGLVITSGIVHADTELNLIGKTIEEKTKKVMENLEAILKAAELTFDDVIKATVFVTDMSEYTKFNEVYVTYFKKKPMPAREVVCVKELPLSASLEITMMAKK